MKPRKEAADLFLMAKEDCEACAGLVQLGVAHRVICFLSQQTVEKCFKALLAQREATYPYTHDLVDLEHLLQSHRFSPPFTPEELDMLNPFAVEIRYGFPGEELPPPRVVLDMAQRALRWCEEMLHA